MERSFSSLRNVLVLCDTKGISSDLAACLAKCGYTVTTHQSTQPDIAADIYSLKPQAVLITILKDFAEHIDLIRKILSFRTTAVVIVTQQWNATLSKQAMDYGVAGYISEPFDAAHIGSTLETSWHHFQRLIALQEDLEIRKLIEKAKGLLMKEQFITEEEAHQTLLRMSQDQSVPLKEVCQSIIQIKAALSGDRFKHK